MEILPPWKCLQKSASEIRALGYNFVDGLAIYVTLKNDFLIYIEGKNIGKGA